MHTACSILLHFVHIFPFTFRSPSTSTNAWHESMESKSCQICMSTRVSYFRELARNGPNHFAKGEMEEGTNISSLCPHSCRLGELSDQEQAPEVTLPDERAVDEKEEDEESYEPAALTHEEIWDDRALIRAFDDAVKTYTVLTSGSRCPSLNASKESHGPNREKRKKSGKRKEEHTGMVREVSVRSLPQCVPSRSEPCRICISFTSAVRS